MKSLRTVSIVIGIAVLITVVALVVSSSIAQDTAAGLDPARYPVDTITVTGNGTAAGAPDIATMELGVETRNADVAAAFAENNATIEVIINALVEAGIAREDIRTTGLNVYMERYSMDMNSPMPEGGTTSSEMTTTYVVNNMVRVVVRDTSAVGNIVSVAVGAGANNMYGLNFGIEDQTELENEARAEAMTDAQSRATALAQLAGVELGEILIINESWSGSGPFDVMNYAERSAAGVSAAPIEPGQLSVQLQVSVTYRINR